jgi:hypothetical protein
MKEFTFEFTYAVTVQVDEALESLVGDPDFEETFWPLDSLEQLAHHIAWNHAVMKWSHVEGLTPEEHEMFKILGSGWEDD